MGRSGTQEACKERITAQLRQFGNLETAQLLVLILVFFPFITINVSCPAKFGNLSIHRILEELVIFSGIEGKTEIIRISSQSNLVGRQMIAPEYYVIRKSASLNYMKARFS